MGERPPFDWHRPIGPSEAQKARDAERMSQLAVEAMKRQVKAMLTDPTPATPDEADLLETAWGIIANAGGGDWTTQTYEWASAAARWRSDYFAYLDSRQQGDAVAGVYRERARLVAALARLYPASLERADPSPGFEWVVYVDLPTGQASWHVSDDDLDLFDGGPPLRLLRLWGRFDPQHRRVGRRALVVVGLGWVPLMALALFSGAYGHPEILDAFVRDASVHARSLLAAPLLVLAEAVCIPRLGAIAQSLCTRGIVPSS